MSTPPKIKTPTWEQCWNNGWGHPALVATLLSSFKLSKKMSFHDTSNRTSNTSIQFEKPPTRSLRYSMIFPAVFSPFTAGRIPTSWSTSMAWSFWRRLMNSSTVHWSIWIPFKKHVPPLSVYYTHTHIYIYYIHYNIYIYAHMRIMT